MQHTLLAGLLVFCLTSCSGLDANSAEDWASFRAAPCVVGIYGSADSFVAITRRGDDFSYAFSDGRRGTINGDAGVACGYKAVSVDRNVIWKRRPIRVTNTVFISDGTALVGQLLEPNDAGSETPLVALAHGSEELGWIESVSYPYQFVGRGVSVFVYDKRGTGQSAGKYTQNFPQLADDLIAASLEAQRLAEGRYGRFGLFGFSQGGWIAPLAADASGADFIGIGYGLVVNILEEDASQVAMELREAGYGQDVISKAKTVTDVTARLAVSNYSDGLEELDLLRTRYGEEPWFQMIKGGFSGVILGMPTEELHEKGIPMFDRLNIDWSVKPMDVLVEVDVPQLWVLAEQDREAPIATTLERLQYLRRQGKDVTILVFPETDHGMWEFQQAPDGTRQITRITSGYYDVIADWAKGSLAPSYSRSNRR